uniref:Uncharacterized protein n=1 Tax=Solanum tuberosum TaxID=4113 RepID=M1BNT0_SOLTU
MYTGSHRNENGPKPNFLCTTGPGSQWVETHYLWLAHDGGQSGRLRTGGPKAQFNWIWVKIQL